MSQIEIRAQAGSESRPQTRRRSAQTAINDRLSWFLMAVLALAPLPFGSHRPFFWALNGGIIGLAGLVYAFTLGRMEQDLRIGWRQFALPFGLFLTLCAYLVVQMLPLGGLFGLVPAVANDVALAIDTISITPDDTGLMLVRFVTYGLFGFLVLQAAFNPSRAHFMLGVMLYIITFYAGFGLASLSQFGDTLLGLQKWAYQGTATATFVNRNSFATFLAFGAVIGVARICDHLATNVETAAATDRPLKLIDTNVVLDVICVLLIVGAIVATQSRMGAMAGLVGCIVVLFTFTTRGLPLRTTLPFMVPVLVLIIIAMSVMFGTGLFDRLGSVENNADDRSLLYGQIMEVIAARPWIGFGGDSFEQALAIFHHFPLSTDVGWDMGHNTYLTLWAELGLVFGSIPIVLAALALLALVRRLGTDKHTWVGEAAAIGVLATGAVHSLVDFSLEIQAVTLVYVAALSIGLASAWQAARKKA